MLSLAPIVLTRLLVTSGRAGQTRTSVLQDGVFTKEKLEHQVRSEEGSNLRNMLNFFPIL